MYVLTGWAAWCARGRRPAREPAGVPAAAWLALMGRAAVCAGGRRPAREIATREPAARSGRSRGPPWPCHRPPAPRPGPVGQADGLSETSVAFAHLCLCGVETAVAFAGEKWVFLVQFSGAVVMLVSCWPVSAIAVVSVVSMSPCCCALCTKKFAMRGLLLAAAVQSSPCIRKMRQKGHFERAWRVLYRKWPGTVLVGRVLSRLGATLVPCCRPSVARCTAARPGRAISAGLVGLTVPSAPAVVVVLHL